MENIKKRRIIEIIIFLTIVISSLISFRPAAKALEERLGYVRDNLIKILESEFEVKITYASMSPSFFDRITIRDVNIYNAKTNEKIAYFSLIYFDYRIYSLIKKDFTSIFSDIGIYDGIIDFNSEKNKNILKKLENSNNINVDIKRNESAPDIDIVSSIEGNSIKIIEIIEKKLKNLKDLKSINIELKNVALNYSNRASKIDFHTYHGKFTLNSGKIDFNLNSNLRYNSFTKNIIPTFSTSINVNGAFYPNTLSASSIINFSDIKFGNIYIDKFSIFTSYFDRIASITTLQNIQPIDLKGAWNTLENTGSISLECKNLKPLLIISNEGEQGLLSNLKESSFTGYFNLDFSPTKNILWNSEFGIAIPTFQLANTKISKSILSFNANGDNNLINLNKLDITGHDVNLSGSGSYKIKEMLPNFDLNIKKFKLASGENLSMNLNVFSKQNKIFANIPKIKFGKAYFENIQTVLEKKTEKTDFYFSLKDNSGNFKIDGTWTEPKNKNNKNDLGYLELHGVSDSISISNIYYAGYSLKPFKIPVQNIAENFLSQMQMTNEFYISSDFKQLSYNVIQMVLASNTKNGFYSLFSLKGNESSFNISNIDLSLNNMHLQGNINSVFENEGVLFDSLLTLNDISYKIAGLLTDEMFSIYGDYGLNINILKNNQKKLTGSMHVKELPIPFINSVFSTDSSFAYDNDKNWQFNCKYAALEYIETDIIKSDESLEFYVEGYAKPEEIFFHKVKAGIKNKQLEGTAAFNSIPILHENINQYEANISLSDKNKEERFIFDSIFSISDKIYFDGRCSIENITLNRFFKKQKQENKINAEFIFLGNKDALSIKSDLKEINFNLNGRNLEGKALAHIDNNQISVSETALKWGIHRIDKIKALITPAEQKASLEFEYGINTTKQDTKASFMFNFVSTAENKNDVNQNIIAKTIDLTSHFNLTMQISDWMLAGKKGEQNINASLIREPNIIALYAGENDKIYGFKTDDGVISLHIDESLPVHLNLDGTLKNDSINLSITDIGIDLATVVNSIPNNDIIKFYAGSITGNLKIQGTQKDPLFYGNLTGEKLYCTSPNYSPDTYGYVNIPIKLEGSSLSIPYTIVPGKIGSLWAEVTSEFIGWIPYYTTINCGVLEKTQALIKTKNIAFHADGGANGKIKLEINPEHISLEGAAHFDKGYFSVPFSDLQRQKGSLSNHISFSMNLDLTLGKKTEFRYPSTDFPFLRAITYTEDKPINLNLETITNRFEMSGYARIRTGEIFYIKRNFYIREGELKILNTPLQIEPIISVRAEIRDKTTDGQPLTITLTAKDQYLDIERFKPTISTSPPMALSDFETMTLIGQVALSDLGKGNVLKETLLNASDILAQMGFFKRFEQEIRNSLHIDVFSLRSLLIQNVILENLFRSSNDRLLTIGNYFDNTSVYIGKYFGSAIYADAMLHLSYYDPLSIQKDIVRKPVYGNLLFQPEIGLEMNTPFFLLRWHVAPSNPDTLFVPDAGLTISWKYSY